MQLTLPDEAVTLELAERVYHQLSSGCLIYLEGELGTGKTTFVRGCLRAAGFQGAVKSPTFTLVEEYTLPTGPLFHFDLYRVKDPEELELMGFRDYLRPDALCFVEWPSRGGSGMPEPDLWVYIRFDRYADFVRRVDLLAGSRKGWDILYRLETS